VGFGTRSGAITTVEVGTGHNVVDCLVDIHQIKKSEKG
jgi:hypothetical protein